MIHEEQYTIRLSDQSRMHVDFKTQKAKVVDFAVNFEILYKKKWQPILRYDTAHQETEKQKWKFPHKHTYYRDGRETIISMGKTAQDIALTFAIKDIQKNFKSIKDKFFN